VLCQLSAEAQILNRIKNKVQQAIERKVQEKVEEKVDREVDKAAGKAVDEAWEAVFGPGATDEREQSSVDTAKLQQLRSLMGGSANVHVEPTYTFDTRTTLKLAYLPKSGKVEPPKYLEMYLTDGANYSGSAIRQEGKDGESGQMFIIADYANKAMILLMSEGAQKYATHLSMDSTLYPPPVEADATVNWNEVTEWRGYRRLGSRTIQGYACEGYVMANETGKSEVWVTRDMDVTMGNPFYPGNMRSNLPREIPYGVPVEVSAEDLTTGDRTLMTLSEVKKGIGLTLRMSDYPRPY